MTIRILINCEFLLRLGQLQEGTEVEPGERIEKEIGRRDPCGPDAGRE
jgi:hypothetical protein